MSPHSLAGSLIVRMLSGALLLGGLGSAAVALAATPASRSAPA